LSYGVYVVDVEYAVGSTIAQTHQRIMVQVSSTVYMLFLPTEHSVCYVILLVVAATVVVLVVVVFVVVVVVARVQVRGSVYD